MILRPPLPNPTRRRIRIRNLNTLQTIIDRALPALQLQPRIRAIREQQRVAGELLHGLGVELLGECEIAVFESRVALLFESVGGGGHWMRRGPAEVFLLLEWVNCLTEIEARGSSEARWCM